MAGRERHPTGPRSSCQLACFPHQAGSHFHIVIRPVATSARVGRAHVQAHRLVQVCVLVMTIALTGGLAVQTASAQTQPDAELRARVQTLEEQVKQLKAELDALRGQIGAAPQPVAAAAPATAAAAGNSKIFNPDTSVIGNFLGVAGKNPQSEQPPLSLTEVEAAFQAVVDPYARADFFLSASPEGLEVEEGYITFTSLPAGVLLKAGKMRAQFGKVNTMHTHILPWADRPLVSQNLFGGEEGVADSGFSVSRLIPNSFMFIDAIGEVYRGDSDVFKSEARSKLNYLGRLRGYRDLTEGTNIDLGVSYTRGPSAALQGYDAQLTGVDATFRYRPLRRAIYRQFVGRTEFIWMRQDAPAGLRQSASGFYGSADYQFARRWFIGVRGDRSGRALANDLRDSGGSVHLTFRPTEFSLVRGQYRRTSYAEGIDANELLFQLSFSIGAHGAHSF